MLLRGDEVHGDDGPEVHCIRPGRYFAILRRSGVEIWSAEVEYVQTAVNQAGGGIVVHNQTPGVNKFEHVISPTYLPRGGSNAVVDLVLNIDLQSGLFADSAVADIDVAGADPFMSTFANLQNPAGTNVDFFRMSVARSTSSWNRPGRLREGRMLTRFWWDRGTVGAKVSGYIDAHPADALLMATYQFGPQSASTRLAVVGVDHKRPDELPMNVPQLERTVTVNKAGANCLTYERLSTWLITDQYLTTGCAPRGAGISYHWQFATGGPVTVTSDTLMDFRGHSTGAQQTVTLTAKNGTTILRTWNRTFNVTSTINSLNGPTFITDKQLKSYTSGNTGDWYERFNPQLAWFSAVPNASSMTRIWPYGDYTAELRQEIPNATVLKRGRLSIQVCRTNCIQPQIMASTTSDRSNDLLGAGPILTWGSGL